MSKRKHDEMSAIGLPPNTVTLLETGLYSDLVIKCKEKEFKVHRAIVCLQSEPMAGSLRGEFKEATTGVIDLSDDDLEIVEIMIRFFYTGELTLPASTANPVSLLESNTTANTVSTDTITFVDTSNSLLICTNTYIMADRFAVRALKVAAKVKYESALVTGWHSATFAASLKLMFEETLPEDRLLKDVAVRFAGQKAKLLLDRGDFVILCKENSEISYEVMRATVDCTKENANCTKVTVVTSEGKGCPWFGLHHKASIAAGRNKKYWCTQCKKAFDNLYDS